MVWEEEVMGVKKRNQPNADQLKHMTAILAKVEAPKRRFGHYKLVRQPAKLTTRAEYVDKE